MIATVAAAIVLLPVGKAAAQNAGGAAQPGSKQSSPPIPKSRRRVPPKKPTNVPPPEAASSEGFEALQPLIQEIGELAQKMKTDVQLPPARFHSQLLPLLPADINFYVSFPNYGEALEQAHHIFHEQLPLRPNLREWWDKVQSENTGPSIDEVLDKVHQFSEYLGGEIVLAGEAKGFGEKPPAMLLLAQIRKPGLDAFLRDLLARYGGGKPSPITVLDRQQLIASKDREEYKGKLLVVVRPDYLVAGSDLEAVQAFNADLDRGAGGLGSAPFGQRLAQAYQNGVETLAGADVQALLRMRPRSSEKTEALWRQSGFDDMKYLILERRDFGGAEATRLELSFENPRHGMAAWLAPAGPMGSLEFISESPALVVGLRLKNLAQIADELRTIVGSDASKPNPFDSAEATKLRDTLLSKLTGEIAIAVDSPGGPEPSWLAVLKASDAAGVESAIGDLLLAAPGGGGTAPTIQQEQEEGITFNTVQVPSAAKPVGVTFASTDGYLLIGTGRQKVMEAIHRRKNGRSLASKGLSGILPQDHANVSAVFYEDFSRLAAIFANFNPEMAKLPISGQSLAYGGWIYADDMLLQAGSNTRGMDFATLGAVAAILIPGLIHEKVAANESAAASALRSINSAQATYSTAYPQRGYAPDLGALGPGLNDNCDGGPTAAHGCFIDAELGCTSGVWCVKDAYRYSLTAQRKNFVAVDYVAVATPLSGSSGTKSYCSTSDGIIRWKQAPPLVAPVSVAECLKWAPLDPDERPRTSTPPGSVKSLN